MIVINADHTNWKKTLDHLKILYMVGFFQKQAIFNIIEINCWSILGTR